MAYDNYLIRVGSSSTNYYTIPEAFIQFDSYQVLLSTTDLDPWRDAEGYLHRTALAHKVGKVEFNTPYMYSDAFELVMANIRQYFPTSGEYANEKRVYASVYIPETNSYVSGYMYLSDVTMKIYKKNSNGTFIYEPTRFAFIGY